MILETLYFRLARLQVNTVRSLLKLSANHKHTLKFYQFNHKLVNIQQQNSNPIPLCTKLAQPPLIYQMHEAG
eukprot:403359250